MLENSVWDSFLLVTYLLCASILFFSPHIFSESEPAYHKYRYGNWLLAMRDHQTVSCSPAGRPPAFPQANVDVCCDPPDNGFGCDYTGVPGGERFGSLAVKC